MIPSPPTRKPSEDGFILLAVLILLALFTIALAVALPKISADIQRDRDVETMQRGKQYVRGIKLYYKKFHAYPPNLDALNKTNEIRFVRKKYIDPTTGKVDWKPISMCQNKTPMAMGFFGQPLGAASGCGVMGGGALPGGGTGLPGSPLQGGVGTAGTTGTSFNSSPTGGGGIFSNPPATGTTDSGTGTSTTGDQSGTGTGDQSGTGGTGSTGGTTGQTFGGGGVVGVSPASPKKSIYVFKKKDHYNQWEFLYSPIQDMQQQMSGTGLTGGGTGTNGTGQPGSGLFNQNPGGLGPGNNGGPAPVSPTPTPTPTPQ